MTRLHLVLLASVALILPAAPALAQQNEKAPNTAAAEQSAHDQLFTLFAWADEEELRLNPISALFRGDMRYADKLGDYLTPEHTAASRKLAQDSLDKLARIDREKLNATDRIAYDVFKYNNEDTLEGLSPEVLALTETRPINHFSGFHTFYPTFASGQSAAPFKTVEDYENNLRRHDDYIALIDRSIGKFREGLASGVVETRLTIGNVIEQLDTQLAMPLEESPFWGPVTIFPEEFSEAEKAQLTSEYRAKVEAIYAAHGRLRDFLRNEYIANARDEVGLSQMKGGDVLYGRMIKSTTTLPLTADYLHNLGLSEVKRIHGEMEKVKQQVGFTGTLGEFFDHIRNDPNFKPESREGLTQGYYAIGKAVDEKIGALFSTLPKTPLEIRPYEPFREKFEAGGSYQQGAPDGSNPGVFYFNAYDLPSRTTPGMTTLYLHEGAPGHHFQISLAQENEALPAFMRFGGNTAYVEGWALYAETLGFDMGLFDDPYQRFGTLDDEMLRAMRLVVDTGLHSKGWTRDQAIEYMLANSSMGRTDATAEVERYIAIPSQALAYKVGALKIQELRKRAQERLGDRFDISEFHEVVLGTGALPLPVLDKKVDDWIESRLGAD